MAKKEAPETTEAPDHVAHTDAKVMFADNPGLFCVRVQLDDGRIGDLTRDGTFTEQAAE